jgi:hypothetical protein
MNRKLEAAKKMLADHPDVTSIGFGYRYKDGAKTGETCIVVGVEKKLPQDQLPTERLIPLTIEGEPTDVQERRIVAYDILPGAQALVQRKRPCPPGFSIGHTAVSAGTLGAYVKRGTEDEWWVLSNNHVIAASNDGTVNDKIIQPGKADGGFSGTDHFAWLREYARIKWDGDENGKKKVASFLWKLWMAPANGLARLVKCPYRLQVHHSLAIEQPYPNLVDAALAMPVIQGYVKLEYPFDIGELQGIRDLELGDRVQKVGRTTEHTLGTVEGVQTMVRVQYSAGKMATFDDQLEVRADSGEFSQPGDSGSAIVDEDSYLGGLLFAGGSGVTIANRISNVVSLLGVRLS